MSDTPRSAGGHILIVDDDATNRRILESVFAREGLATMSAGSGAEALTLAESTPPDAVVLDLMMPGMDGYEVCRRLKLSRSLRNIPVLFLSAVDDPESRAQGLDVGGVDFMLKTTSPRELIARLRRHAVSANDLRSAIGEREKFAAAGRVAQMEMDEAAVLQRGALADRWPTGTGYRFAARYEPCQRIGGDLFGFVTNAAGETVVYVLDISGHGAAAAIVAGLASHLLEQALKTLPPDEALSKLEHEFPAARYNRYFTAVCVSLAKDGTVLCSKAGHPDPIHIGRGGIGYLKEGGAPIGLGMGDQFPREQLRLESGDRILLYTDGLTDACNAQRVAFGAAAVAEALAESKVLSIIPCLDRLLKRAVEHCDGQPAKDDITAVLIEYRGSAA